MRVGRVVAVDEFPEARKPAWKLRSTSARRSDAKSSAQITHYSREQLEGTLVAAVVNFPARRIARSRPRCWCSARPRGERRDPLRPTADAPLGGRMF